MYYLKVGVGIVMCFVGGWQLANVLDEGNESASAGEVISSGSYKWRESCAKIAQRAWKSDYVSPVEYNAGLLKLREQGCDPSYAPAGTVPSVSDPSDDWGEEDEWKDEVSAQYENDYWPE